MRLPIQSVVARLLLIASTVVAMVAGASAATVVLQITAGNPSSTDVQPVEIRQNLPKGTKPEDVIDAGGLEVAYDVKDDLYYVHAKLDLGPKEVRQFRIELADVWTIPTELLDRMGNLSASRAAQLQSSDEYKDTANRLKGEIDKNLGIVRESQTRNAIGPARPLPHIRAYELNLKVLDRIKEDLGHLENFVLSTGQEPGELAGLTVQTTAPRDQWDTTKLDYATAMIRFEVQNPSTNAVVVPVRQNLPPELKPDDVTAPEGLRVGFDESAGVVYVYSDDIEFGPAERREFQVIVRDKWAIPAERLKSLETRTTNLIAVLATVGKFPALDTRLAGVRDELRKVAAQEPPATLNEQYVAFYRGQARVVDELEKQLLSVEQLLQKRAQQSPDWLKEASDIFLTRAPDKKTTWIIIYIILGFFLLVSLVFFLRWSGKARGE